MILKNNVTHKTIVDAIEAIAQPQWQDGFDNTGWQTANPDDITTGVLLCVDVTPEIVIEAVRKNCNLIISHHPLLFHAVKSVIPQTGRVEKVLMELIRNGISLYSCHTSIDNAPAPYGVSYRIAEILGLEEITPLTTAPGAGAKGILPRPLTLRELAERVKERLGAPCVRVSCKGGTADTRVSRIALCGGAGIDFIDDAIRSGAEVYICSDVKHNWLLDRRDSISLIEVGHYEAEKCTRDIFASILRDAPVPVLISETENNPVIYI